MPHTSGGGSRQSGPDDNAPVSATQIPDPPNHIIPSSLTTTLPSTTFAYFLSFITHASHNEYRSFEIPILASEFCFKLSSNIVSGFAAF